MSNPHFLNPKLDRVVKSRMSRYNDETYVLLSKARMVAAGWFWNRQARLTYQGDADQRTKAAYAAIRGQLSGLSEAQLKGLHPLDGEVVTALLGGKEVLS